MNDSHHLRAFSSLGPANAGASFLGRREGRVDEALGSIQCSGVTQHFRQLAQGITQHVVAAPLLKAAMNRLVVRVALGKHVPLSARVQDPERALDELSGRNWFASRTIVRAVLFQKMLADAIPLLVGESQCRAS